MKTHDLVPYLSVADAQAAIDFYGRVLDARTLHRLDMPDGRVMHCELGLGDDARLYLSEELPEHGGTPSPGTLGATTVAMHLFVDDCDDAVERFAQHGAEVLMAPEDMFWGVRFARVRDPFGHEWGLTKVLREMTPEEIEVAAAALFEEGAEP